MTKHPENPYAAVGNIVHGAAHIGRLNQLDTLRQRILDKTEPGATAIVGPPRIGKSSLAYHTFMRTETRQAYPRLIPVWMNTRLQSDDAERVFRVLVEEVWSALVEGDADLGHALIRRHEAATRKDRDLFELVHDTQRFLQAVRERGWQVVLVLDEFDAAREVFRSRAGTFQALRELAYNPTWMIGLVTISRRELREIVNKADPVESTFPGIFRELHLTCFDRTELTSLVERGFTDPAIVERIVGPLLDATGGHPYLASTVLADLWTQADTDVTEAAIAHAIGRCRTSFLNYYDDLEQVLRADGRFQVLLEVVLGPQLTASPDDAERLLHEGIIRVKGESYATFSDDFTTYLTWTSRKGEYWQTWAEVETGLRNLVDSTLVRIYGAPWVDAARRARPRLAAILNACKSKQDNEQRTFAQRASTRLVDFTYPADLWAIMTNHWDTFGTVLRRDRNYWNERFNLLCRVRNPMAHNRMSAVTPVEREVFLAYCAELLEILASA